MGNNDRVRIKQGHHLAGSEGRIMGFPIIFQGDEVVVDIPEVGAVQVETHMVEPLETEWPEDRADIIGQNGNDGLHYAEQEKALAKQEGGNHYKDMAIQPVEFIHRNEIPYLEGNAIKYLCRWRKKNGLEDLRKARHYIDLLIEMEAKK